MFIERIINQYEYQFFDEFQNIYLLKLVTARVNEKEEDL
jgi:hypothetical protein